MNMADDDTMENGADVEIDEIEVPRRGRGRPRRGEMSPREKIEFDQEDAIAEFIAKEKDAGAVIEIKRKQSNGKYAHLVTMALADWDKERLAETYGGGEYKVIIKKSDGKYGNQFSFNIDHLRKPRADEGDKGNVMEAVAKALTANQPSVDQFKDLMAEQQSRSDRMFALMMQQSQENTKMMIGMMTAMAQGRPQAGGTDPVLGQIISSLLAHTLKEKHQGIDQLVDGVVKLKQIAEGGRPVGIEEEPGGGWLPKLLEFLPQVLSGFLAAKAAQTGQPVPVAAPAQPLPAQPAQPARTKLTPEQEKAVMVNNYIQMLIGMAQQGVPVEQTYQKFEPMCTDDVYTEIADFLLTPDWWERFSANNPPAVPHRQWFEALRKLWLDNFDEQPTTQEQPQETQSGAINAKVEVLPDTQKKKEKESEK